MDINLRAQVKDLHDKYMPVLGIWFSKNTYSHKLYGHFMNLERTLKGIIPVKDQEMLAALSECLDKFFPKEMFFAEPIVLDSDSDDDVNNKNDSTNENSSPFQVPNPHVELPPSLDGFLTPPPDLPSSPSTSIPAQAHRNVAVKSTSKPSKLTVKKQVSSIAEYKTKTTKLKPAAAYAKPNDRSIPKVHISVPYKEPATTKAIFDPKTEAIKLNGVRERVYAKLFLNNNQNETENIVPDEIPVEEEPSSSKSRQRQKSCIPKPQSSHKIQIFNRRKSCCAVLEEKIQLTGKVLRQKPKRSYLEPKISDEEDTSEESTENFNQIPIQKSQSTKRKKCRGKNTKRSDKM